MASETARAFWVVAPGRGVIRAEPLRRPSPGEVAVQTMYSGISRGTEALVFDGRVPTSEYQRMRAPFQAGDFPGPVEVRLRQRRRRRGRAAESAGPPRVRALSASDALRRAGRGGLRAARRRAARARGARGQSRDGDQRTLGRPACMSAIASPSSAPEPSAVWSRGWRDGSPAVGSSWSTSIHSAPRWPSRWALALRTPDSASEGADVVIHTSGVPDGLQLALRIAGLESTIVDMSWYGTQSSRWRSAKRFTRSG